MNNIKLKEIAIYHPDNLVSNEFYLEHFQKRGEDIEGFLKAMGRDKRYIINHSNENSVTMGIEAAKRVLEKAQLTGRDIDMIIFSSQVPEYTFPANATFIHKAIGALNHCMIYDNNANCAGMTVAVDTASRYMMSNKRIKRALVVGSDANSLVSNPEVAFTFSAFSDGAAAVILEKTNEDVGYIDAVYEVDSNYDDNMFCPKNGFSNSTGGDDKYVYISPKMDGSVIIPSACQMIEQLLKDNDLTIDDIDAFCLSQFALSNILKLQEHFGIDDEKILYVGDKYGYTSTSSPFFALHEGVETGRIKDGSTVLYWTVGTGHEMIAMLFKH